MVRRLREAGAVLLGKLQMTEGAFSAHHPEKSGGVGAAKLQHGRCGGCQLEANNADMSAYRAAAADDVIRREECGRILVRAADSGL